MFVPPDQLPFDLAALIEKGIEEWSKTQPLGFTRPVAESCGEFIIAEMEAAGLGRLEGEDARFNDEASPQDFRTCVFSALDHWLIKVEISTKRRPEDVEDYYRPCSE